MNIAELVVDQVLSDDLQRLLPNDDDVEFYREHGWYVTPEVLEPEVLDRAMEGAMRFYAGERDAILPIDSGFSNWTSDSPDAVRNNEFTSLQNRELAELVRQPIIGAIAARLTGSRSIRLFDDQLVYKPGGDRGVKTVVGWHADHAYWGTCSSHSMLTAWIPFHDIDESRSPLLVIDGSHRWSDLENTRYFSDTDLGTFEQEQRDKERAVRTIPIVVKRGQMSFHHCWTMHASGPNRSDDFRLAMALHLQDHDNEYQPCYDQAGAEVHVVDELLCRKLPDGRPDFTDPQVFPTLWTDR